jgi:hypothetical protein
MRLMHRDGRGVCRIGIMSAVVFEKQAIFKDWNCGGMGIAADGPRLRVLLQEKQSVLPIRWSRIWKGTPPMQKVINVGAGLAGLATGGLLAGSGLAVNVFEAIHRRSTPSLVLSNGQ